MGATLRTPRAPARHARDTPLTNATTRAGDDTFRFIAIVGVCCALSTLAALALSLHGHAPLPVDRNGVPLGRDFVNTWFYGRSFFDADPGRFYDRASYMDMVRTVLPSDPVDRLWSYPPPFLLVAAPFGLLPYLPALAAWTACGLLALGLALRRAGSGWMVAAALTSPTVVFAVVAGQVSLLVAAVISTAFAQLDRRPVRAGLLLSLLVVKPQTILLVPVLLVASRRWRVLAAAAAGTAAIVALSVAANGPRVWTCFIATGVPAQVAEMRGTIDVLAPFSVSLTTAAIETGMSAATASSLQLAAALVAAALVALVGWRSRKDGTSTDYECLVMLTCSIFASPYFILHDLAPFSAAAIIVASRSPPIARRWALLTILFVPMLQQPLSALHVYAMPFLALGFAGLLVARRRTLGGGHAAVAPGSRAGGDGWPCAAQASLPRRARGTLLRRVRCAVSFAR